MLQKYTAVNNLEDERPSGGSVAGVGLMIEWQKGPLGRGKRRSEANGSFVETVIDAARQRIEFYEDNGFACKENKNAIYFLEKALAELECRTVRREAEGVEGTHERRRG